MSRLEELAAVFERAAASPTNIIDPPFDCVPLNLKPATCAEVAKYLRAMQTLADQANAKREQSSHCGSS